MADDKVNTEAELEAFRRRWREEVARKQKGPNNEKQKSLPNVQHGQQRRKSNALPSSSTSGGATVSKSASAEKDHDDFAPRPYHDLPDKEDNLKLGTEDQSASRAVPKEPRSALEHYERAVEKETQGNLQDSMLHYRKAFKLDDGVHELYKKKHFPPSFFTKPKAAPAHPSSSTVPKPSSNTTQVSSEPSKTSALPSSLKQLAEEFSSLRIEAAPPPTDASPQKPCRIAELPEEILTQILGDLAESDVAAFVRMAQVCKRLAYLVFTEESVWRRVALGDAFGFKAMHYDYACDILGGPVQDEVAPLPGSYDDDTEEELPEIVPLTPFERAAVNTHITEQLLREKYTSSWRQMFRTRPRIRFNGCYISTVNYTRPGAQASNSLVWGNSVHVVTYFRYLRFFRDGTLISLLTTEEPADVVHHLIKDNLHNNHNNTLPSSVMKDALRGRWRLTSPLSSHSVTAPPPENDKGKTQGGNADSSVPADDLQDEVEGEVHIETEGVVERYTYRMLLSLSHAGKGARNNKLAWKGFWSHNRLTDDWGEFELRNDRAFYWSRVKSYGMGY